MRGHGPGGLLVSAALPDRYGSLHVPEGDGAAQAYLVTVRDEGDRPVPEKTSHG